MKPVVAIVGRANVGKSTLFNRLTHTKLAIIEDEEGVTRDRLYRDVNWSGKTFTLIDTGGIEVHSQDEILRNVRFQAQMAIDEADLILFMVDQKVGITQTDEEIAHMLRQSGKDVIVIANKMESFEDMSGVYEFYSLGFPDVIGISASHGSNTGDLLDEVLAHLEKLPLEDEVDDDHIKIAVVGRPNVGKSSLTNVIIGEERSIVSDVAGTTRDAVDSDFYWHGEKFTIVDTAGMRKRKKIDYNVERYSVSRSLYAVDKSDVVLMVINADEGLIEQDKKIVGYAHEQGKGIIVIVNKWDLVEKDTNTQKEFEQKLRAELLFLSYAPILFVSAKTHQRVSRIMETVKAVAETRSMRLSTSLLNEILRDAIMKNPPPTDKGRRLKIYYMTQVGINPPAFALFVNDESLMHFSYLRYIENRIRDYFVFEGTTLKFFLRERKGEE